MNYDETKSHLIDEICEQCEKIKSNDSLGDILKYIESKKPITLKEYIKTELSNMIDDEVLGNNENTMDNFEYEIRRFGSRLNGIKKLKTKQNKNVNDWYDLEIECLSIDDWISQYVPLFNPVLISIVIFKIFIGEVVWS